MRTLPWTIPALTALLILAVACSDDSSSGDTGGSDASGDAGDDAISDADGGGDGGVDADVADEPLPERTCGRPPAQNEVMRYDAMSPIGSFIAEADITLADGDVTVDLIDFDDPEFPSSFGGTFAAGSHCADAVFTGFDVDICFFNPDGSTATPESLGSQIFVFLDGSPTNEPDVSLVGGLRRGLDLSCSMVGFFPLDTSGLTETGDLPEAVGPAVTEALLGYVALFEVGGGEVNALMGDPPAVDFRVTSDLDTGAVVLDVETEITVEVDAVDVDYTVEIDLDGTLDLSSGELSATLTAAVSGEASSGQLSGTVTGTRY